MWFFVKKIKKKLLLCYRKPQQCVLKVTKTNRTKAKMMEIFNSNTFISITASPSWQQRFLPIVAVGNGWNVRFMLNWISVGNYCNLFFCRMLLTEHIPQQQWASFKTICNTYQMRLLFFFRQKKSIYFHGVAYVFAPF